MSQGGIIFWRTIHYDKHRTEMLDVLTMELLQVSLVQFKNKMDNTAGGLFSSTIIANKFVDAGKLRRGTLLIASTHLLN